MIPMIRTKLFLNNNCYLKDPYFSRQIFVNRFQLNNHTSPFILLNNIPIRHFSTNYERGPSPHTKIDETIRNNISNVSHHHPPTLHKKTRFVLSSSGTTFSSHTKPIVTSIHVVSQKGPHAPNSTPVVKVVNKRVYWNPTPTYHSRSNYFLSDYDPFSVKYYSSSYMKTNMHLKGFNSKTATNPEITRMIDHFGNDTHTLLSILGNRDLSQGSDDLYGCVIVKLSRACKDIERAEFFFEKVVQQARNVVGVVTFQSIIQTEVSHARESHQKDKMDLAEELLDRMEQEFLIPPNLEVYTLMAAGYAELGMSEEVESIVEIRMPIRYLHPTDKFLFVIFRAYSLSSNYEKMEEIVNFMERPILSVFEVYIGLFLKQGKVDSAVSLFQNTSQQFHLTPTNFTYSILIEGLVKIASGYAVQYKQTQNQYDQAMGNHIMSLAHNFFKEMEGKHLRASNQLLTAMISGYIATSQYSKIEEMFQYMDLKDISPPERTNNAFTFHLIPIRHLLPNGPSLLLKLYNKLKHSPHFSAHYSAFQISAILHSFIQDDNLDVVLMMIRDLQKWGMTRVLTREMKLIYKLFKRLDRLDLMEGIYGKDWKELAEYRSNKFAG